MIYKLGDLVELVTETNSELKYGLDDIIGVTLEKQMIPTIANLSQTELNDFTIVHPKDFVYNPRTHGKKIGLGFNNSNRCFIATWNNNTFRVKPSMSDVILPEYLYMHFLRDRWDKEACFNAWGSSTVVLLWSSFCNMKINVPSIDEQQRIVKGYRVVTERITILENINEKLENIALSTYQHYFLDYGPYEERLVETSNGKIPDGWTIMSLEDICSKITDGSHYSPVETDKSRYPMLSVKDMGHYGFNYSDCKHMDKSDYLKMLACDCVPLVDDILIAKDGSYLKEVFIVNECKEQAILSSIAIFRANQAIIYPEILLYLLKSPRILQEVKDNYVTGSAITRIVLKNFKKLKLVIPPLEEQAKILPLLRSIRFQISSNYKEIVCLDTLLKHYLSIVYKGV